MDPRDVEAHFTGLSKQVKSAEERWASKRDARCQEFAFSLRENTPCAPHLEWEKGGGRRAASGEL